MSRRKGLFSIILVLVAVFFGWHSECEAKTTGNVSILTPPTLSQDAEVDSARLASGRWSALTAPGVAAFMGRPVIGQGLARSWARHTATPEGVAVAIAWIGVGAVVVGLVVALQADLLTGAVIMAVGGTVAMVAYVVAQSIILGKSIHGAVKRSKDNRNEDDEEDEETEEFQVVPNGFMPAAAAS